MVLWLECVIDGGSLDVHYEAGSLVRCIDSPAADDKAFAQNGLMTVAD